MCMSSIDKTQATSLYWICQNNQTLWRTRKRAKCRSINKKPIGRTIISAHWLLSARWSSRIPVIRTHITKAYPKTRTFQSKIDIRGKRPSATRTIPRWSRTLWTAVYQSPQNTIKTSQIVPPPTPKDNTITTNNKFLSK